MASEQVIWILLRGIIAFLTTKADATFFRSQVSAPPKAYPCNSRRPGTLIKLNTHQGSESAGNRGPLPPERGQELSSFRAPSALARAHISAPRL